MFIKKASVGLILTSIFCLTTFGNVYSQEIKADFVVAKDGSGDYEKVQDAIKAAKSEGLVIFIKPGAYKEQIRISSNHKGLKLIGESYETTLITFHDDQGWDHATAIIAGEDFYAENLTIEQTVDSRAGGRQAEALSVRADRAVFYRCEIDGFQDTYRIKGIFRAYHKECIINGTTDFIYGNGIGLFEDCIINNRANSHITAHNQSTKDKAKYGLVFINCEIKVHPDEKDVTSADLGRPYGNGAKTVYLKCNLGAHIKPEGWSVWKNTKNHIASFYAEYKNFGPGANPDKRVSWSHQLTDTEAEEYTREKIFKESAGGGKLKGDWNPVIDRPTGVQFFAISAFNPERFYSYSNNVLQVAAPRVENLEVSIFTLEGALVLQRKFESTGNPESVAIKIEGFKSGIYPIQSRFDNSVKSGVITLH